MSRPTKPRCRFFALCTGAATTTVPNPILGDVPCCAKCAKWYADMKAR